MKLIPYDKKKIEGDFYRKTKNLAILEEFVESEYDCVEVTEYSNPKPEYCATSLAVSIKRFKMNGIRAIVRKGHVYLVKV